MLSQMLFSDLSQPFKNVLCEHSFKQVPEIKAGFCDLLLVFSESPYVLMRWTGKGG